MRYEDFPLVLFFRLMQRDIQVPYRLYGRGRWNNIVEKWQENRGEKVSEVMLEAKRKVLLETIQFNKISLLIHWLKKDKPQAKEIFEKTRIKWSDDKAERDQTLSQLKIKAEEKLKIYEAQLARLQENEKKVVDDDEKKDVDDDEEEFTEAKLNEAIASLELHGFDIPDYNSLTLGKYDAMTAIIRKRTEKQQLDKIK